MGVTCPIFAITGDATVQARVAGKAAGIDVFLPKPVEIEKLLLQIAALPVFAITV
jgi:DNA-binding response OmpR family regulator